MLDGDELAGVLAHEMGHVTHYHAIKGLARQFGVEQLLKSMTGGFSDLGTVGAGGSLLLALRNLRLGRGDRRGALRLSMFLLAAGAGLDPPHVVAGQLPPPGGRRAAGDRCPGS